MSIWVRSSKIILTATYHGMVIDVGKQELGILDWPVDLWVVLERSDVVERIGLSFKKPSSHFCIKLFGITKYTKRTLEYIGIDGKLIPYRRGRGGIRKRCRE